MSSSLESDAWSIGWVIYLIMMAYLLPVQLISTIGAAHWQLTSCKRRSMREKVQEVKGPVAVVVPCYLPNEADIIKETINHHFFATTLIEELDVYIVYNTPVRMDIEAELSALAEGPLPAGRRLFIQSAERSTSKAANLNHAISKIDNTEYIAIYDADHHPDPTSLAMAIGFLQESGADCVQGSVYIRDGPPFLRMLLQVEFFITYYGALLTLEYIVGNGFFAGSNAVWRADVLKQLDFDTRALCEDIDWCMRGMRDHGVKFKFLPECRSGELTPIGWHALWKQRLRWAMGWDQVSLKFLGNVSKSNIPLRKKAQMLYLFVNRWPFQIIGQILFICNADVAVRGAINPNAVPPMPQHIQLLQTLLLLTSTLMAAMLVVQAVMHVPNIRFLACMLVCQVFTPIYVMGKSVILIASLTMITCGRYVSWEVTARPTHSPKSEPLLEVEEDGLKSTSVLTGGDIPCTQPLLQVEEGISNSSCSCRSLCAMDTSMRTGSAISCTNQSEIERESPHNYPTCHASACCTSSRHCMSEGFGA